MAPPKVPDGWEVETPQAIPEGWEVEKPADAPTSPVEPGTPLDKALKAQTGDVVTVDTPTGPAKFTRSGSRFMTGDELSTAMKSGPGPGERVLEGALSFLSGGGPLLDEMAGYSKAIDPRVGMKHLAGKVTGDAAPSPLEVYRRARDSARRDVSMATRNASPVADVMGLKVPVLPALGAIAPTLATGNPATVLGRIGLSGVLGAEQAVGGSQADLTRGEVADFGKDVLVGGGAGLAAGGAAEGLSAPFRMLSGKLGTLAGEAKDAVAAATQKTKDEAVKSAVGGLGRVVATQGNSMETVLEALRNPQWFDDATVQAAYRLAESPEGKVLLSRAAQNNMAKLTQSLNAEDAARQALDAAKSAAAPSAVASEVAAKTAPSAILSDVGGKAWKSIGQRALLGAAGSGLGAGAAWLTGADPKVGAGIGASAGFMPQGALQFMRNQAASPTVRYGATSLIGRLLESEAGGVAKGAAMVSPLGQQGARETADEREEASISAFLNGG